MLNARIAGVADRAEAKVGDARELPLATGTYDGAISLAAIDHLPRAGIPKALAEAARVLKPGGEFLLMVVNVDGWARFASPRCDRAPPEGGCESVAGDARISGVRYRGTGNAAGIAVFSGAETKVAWVAWGSQVAW